MALNLKKMKMPAPKGKDPMLSLDMGEESAEHEAAESPEFEAGEQEEASEQEAGAGEETPAEEAAELEAMPDEVLVKELKKRGFRISK